MSELLQEFCDSAGVSLRIDRASGVIRGIKVLGLQSRNGREYLPEALARAVGLYEGAKVNVNHPKGHPLAPRDYQERIGVIRNVRHRTGEGLFADFHFNPKHDLSEQLVWDAEHAPENVGFSHNVQARTSRRGETTLVEEIVQVHSVDLVADPATTRGLFESAAPDAAPPESDIENTDSSTCASRLPRSKGSKANSIAFAPRKRFTSVAKPCWPCWPNTICRCLNHPTRSRKPSPAINLSSRSCPRPTKNRSAA